MSAAEVRITLRLPADVHHKLQAAAVANGRSLNAEIVAHLRGGGDLAARLARLEHWAWGDVVPARLPSLSVFAERAKAEGRQP